LPRDALANFEAQIYPAARATAYNADSVPAGEMRAIEERDSNGLKMTRWVGQECFVKAMSRPGRCVLGFLHNDGFFYNTNGQRTG
jgi:hypothetical protein